MGFLRQTRKKKKKEQKSYEGAPFAELEQMVSKRDETEKTMFLSPEDRTVSGARGTKRRSQEGGEESAHSREKIFRGNPILINGPDYLLRISETRMEAFLTLYRRFSQKELLELLRKTKLSTASKKRRWKSSRRET